MRLSFDSIGSFGRCNVKRVYFFVTLRFFSFSILSFPLDRTFTLWSWTRASSSMALEVKMGSYKDAWIFWTYYSLRDEKAGR